MHHAWKRTNHKIKLRAYLYVSTPRLGTPNEEESRGKRANKTRRWSSKRMVIFFFFPPFFRLENESRHRIDHLRPRHSLCFFFFSLSFRFFPRRQHPTPEIVPITHLPILRRWSADFEMTDMIFSRIAAAPHRLPSYVVRDATIAKYGTYSYAYLRSTQYAKYARYI